MPSKTPSATALVDRGFAWLKMDDRDVESLSELECQARDFFALPESQKRRYGSTDFNFGYRHYGRQYSVTPSRPDLNESFAFWGQTAAGIDHSEEIESFATALISYQKSVARFAGTVLAEIAHLFHTTNNVPFERSSYIEINSYIPNTSREFLQDRHEDGHILTILSTDKPGLELELDGKMSPFRVPAGYLLAFPGSLLTDMTAGRIAPMFHQVRNLRCAERMSVLYLVNPEFDKEVENFVTMKQDPNSDISAKARANVAKFGLPLSPLPAGHTHPSKPSNSGH